METTQTLKTIWKKLGIKGRVKNYSSQPLWVLDTDSGKPMAHFLRPMTKSPSNIDADAFRRVDGKAIDGHKSWWKFYDFSTAEIFDDKDGLKVSIITKTAVTGTEFGKKEIAYDHSENWGLPIQLVTNIKRNKRKKIIKYYVTHIGWVAPQQVLVMTCHGKIDNARPVFPRGKSPHIRTRRDRELFNNLAMMG